MTIHSLNHVTIPVAAWLTLTVSRAFTVSNEPPEKPTQFSEYLIKSGYTYSYGLASADLDGDGDLDLTSADTRSFKLYWFENDGKGGFTEHLIEREYRDRLERHAIGDVNRDGKPDVVIIENLHGDVLWYKNSGTPAKDEVWQRFTITHHTIPGAYDVDLADLDGDGDLDVAASTWRLSNKFAWCENPGDPEKAESWKLHVIEENIAETRTIRVGDFNGDGKPDLLGTAREANLTVWYQNLGNKKGDRSNLPERPEGCFAQIGPVPFFARHVIDAKSPQPTHGMPADMDRDGDLDVVVALGMIAPATAADTREIVWYENVGRPGRGTEWKKHVIGGDFDNAFEAIAVDLDGDGDLDVPATSWATPAGRVVWFENSGDPKGKWKMHELKSNWPRANQIIAADLDGDKRPDLIAGAEIGANEVRWWHNEGRK